MRYHSKIWICLALTLGLASCGDFLDTEPTDTFSSTNFYENQVQVDQALGAIYSNLRSAALAEQYYCRGVVGSDESYHQNATQQGPATFTNSADFGETANYWNAAYIGINQANTLLDNVDRSDKLTTEAKNQARGEALFLRGYFHWLLTSKFGDVPIKLKGSTSINDGAVPQSPRQAVYDQVIADMTAAEGLLETQTATLGYAERVTKTVVQGLLARVCLDAAGEPLKDTKRYEEALGWAGKVVATGLYALNPAYQQIFINHAQDKYDVKESIWEIGYYFESAASVQNIGSWVGNRNGVKRALASGVAMDSGFADGDLRIHPRLYRAYAQGDVRREATIANYRYDATLMNKVYIGNTDVWDRYPGKWRRQYEPQLSKSQQRSGTTNFPLLRYADVLLMLAEAENEVHGATAVAYDAINLVRRRGFGMLNGNVVKAITVTNGGSGYSANPVVQVSGGARATAVVAGGVITQIYIERAAGNYATGPFYSLPPAVIITDATGTGAVATATITTAGDADLPLGLSAEQLRQEIRNERYRELAMEGLRQHDLRRWGILLTTMADIANDVNGNTPGIPLATPTGVYSAAIAPSNNIRARDLLWPIPTRELTLNPLLEPTPGY